MRNDRAPITCAKISLKRNEPNHLRSAGKVDLPGLHLAGSSVNHAL
jgi:hypothetical protein